MSAMAAINNNDGAYKAVNDDAWCLRVYKMINSTHNGANS